MTFVSRTGSTTGGRGITSIGHSSPRGNRRPCKESEPVNILTALAENESVVKQETDPERRAIALAWLFHLVGDIHQPLHTSQLFTVDYPQRRQGWK
jgi:S1/P1 Nuclease